MGLNILITGAAGYIGGSVIADWLASQNALFRREYLNAAVRSTDQADALAALGINVFQLDLTDEEAVVECLMSQKIKIVIHCASSIDPELALNLITALGRQRNISGQTTYFIHTSGDSAYFGNSGWSFGEIKDTGPIFELEKQSADSFPIRKTNVIVTEHAKAHGVKSFIVIPPMVYGKGSGPWNRLSVLLPVCIKASLSDKVVHKFAENTKISAVHISDFTTFYARIVENMLRNEMLPNGIDGHYFGQAHEITWWEILDALAVSLYARGLATTPQAKVWLNNEAAAESLGIPVQFVNVLWNSNASLIAENKHKLGWEPKWDKDRLLEKLDDEIEAVLELDQAKSSLIDSLHKAASG